MKVDHVFGVGALHGDGEGFERVEGERHESPDRVVNGSAQKACLDLEFQQPRVPRIKPGQKRAPGYYHTGDSEKTVRCTASISATRVRIMVTFVREILRALEKRFKDALSRHEITLQCFKI